MGPWVCCTDFCLKKQRLLFDHISQTLSIEKVAASSRTAMAVEGARAAAMQMRTKAGIELNGDIGLNPLGRLSNLASYNVVIRIGGRPCSEPGGRMRSRRELRRYRL